MAAPTFVAAGAATLGTTTTSVTITKPAGTVATHTLWAIVVNLGAAVAPTTVPTDWILVDSGTISTSWVGVYWKVAGGSEPANYTWSGFTDSCTGCMIGIAGAGVTSPAVDVKRVQANTNLNGLCNSITTTAADRLIVALVGVADNIGMTTWAATDPATLTERIEQLSSGGLDTGSGIATAAQGSAGATGNLTVTLAGTRNNVTFLIAVKDSSAVTSDSDLRWKVASQPNSVDLRSSSDTGNTANVTSRSPAVPAGAQVDDVMIAFLDVWETIDPTITVPSGFQQIYKVSAGTGVKCYAYWKRLTAVDTGTYTFSWTGAMFATAAVHCVSGAVLTGDPVGTNYNTASGVSTTFPSTTVAPAYGDIPLLLWHGYNDSSGTHTPPTGFAELFDFDSQTGAWRRAAAAGSSTASGATHSVSDDLVSGLIAVQPIASSGGTQVSSDVDLRWISSTQVSSDLDLRWPVRSVTSSDLDARWAVRSTVSSDLDARWAVRSAVSSDVDLRWIGRTQVSSDLNVRWISSTQVSSDLDVRWPVRSVVSSDIDLRWVGRTQVTSDLDVRWIVRSAVSSDADLRWVVETPAGQVSSDLDLRWIGRTQITSDLDVRWAVRSVVTSDMDARWSVRTTVASDADLRWAVRSQVVSNVDLRWVVGASAGQVSSDVGLTWIIEASDRDVTLRASLAAWVPRATLAEQGRILATLSERET